MILVTAASFLGYMSMEESKREQIFREEISQYLPEDDREFWIKNPECCKKRCNKQRTV